MQLGSGRRGSSSFKLGVPSKFNALVLGFLIWENYVLGVDGLPN